MSDEKKPEAEEIRPEDAAEFPHTPVFDFSTLPEKDVAELLEVLGQPETIAQVTTAITEVNPGILIESQKETLINKRFEKMRHEMNLATDEIRTTNGLHPGSMMLIMDEIVPEDIPSLVDAAHKMILCEVNKLLKQGKIPEAVAVAKAYLLPNHMDTSLQDFENRARREAPETISINNIKPIKDARDIGKGEFEEIRTALLKAALIEGTFLPEDNRIMQLDSNKPDGQTLYLMATIIGELRDKKIIETTTTKRWGHQR